MDDNVIDLTAYLNRNEAAEAPEEQRGYFSVWGGEGDRSRFALPLWRSVYLAAGRRAGLIWSPQDRLDVGYPFFVLDLGAEPARTDFAPVRLPPGAELGEVPAVREESDMVTIYLGSDDDRAWFLVLDEREPDQDPLTGKTREDLLFLAGECAGLLFHHELAREVDD